MLVRRRYQRRYSIQKFAGTQPSRSAYTPQVPWLYSASLRDNLLMGLPAVAFYLEEAMHAAVFEEDLAVLDDGLDTMVGPKGVRLSGDRCSVLLRLTCLPALRN